MYNGFLSVIQPRPNPPGVQLGVPMNSGVPVLTKRCFAGVVVCLFGQAWGVLEAEEENHALAAELFRAGLEQRPDNTFIMQVRCSIYIRDLGFWCWFSLGFGLGSRLDWLELVLF